jgi:hypothetical protein
MVIAYFQFPKKQLSKLFRLVSYTRKDIVYNICDATRHSQIFAKSPRRRSHEEMYRLFIANWNSILLWTAPLFEPVIHPRGGVEPGRAIAKVSTNGDVIVMEFDDSALGKTNLFDLVGHTRRFSPERPGYRPNGGSVTGGQLDTARP